QGGGGFRGGAAARRAGAKVRPPKLGRSSSGIPLLAPASCRTGGTLLRRFGTQPIKSSPHPPFPTPKECRNLCSAVRSRSNPCAKAPGTTREVAWLAPSPERRFTTKSAQGDGLPRYAGRH